MVALDTKEDENKIMKLRKYQVTKKLRQTYRRNNKLEKP